MDAVITYVDINDSFLKQYNKYSETPADEKRFKSYGVLDLQIKLIRKYASFINNIFIVVSDPDQVPDNLDLTQCKIVYHKDIIPEKYLPCFNSCTIEMFLYNIHGLDEEFVYFNDDMFIIDYVSKKDFFFNHKPSLPFAVKDVNKNETNIYKHNLYNSTNLIAELLNCKSKYEGKYISTGHGYYPLLRSVCEKVFNKNRYKITMALTRFRHRRNYNTSVFHNYNYITKNYNPIDINYIYTSSFNTLSEIIDMISNKPKKFICINDTNYYLDFSKFRRELRNALTANLNDEKYIKSVKHINVDDNITVTFTSWKNRINDCIVTINEMLNQTLLPDRIILNLSTEEFPNKEKELPEELINIINDNEICEIYWVKENYKQFKKLIHTLNRFPNDIIISIDDDFPYPENFIETLYFDYINNKKLNPISYSDFKDRNGHYTHHGSFTITESKFYGNYINEILDEFIYPNFNNYKCYDDQVYTEAALLNGFEYKMGSINYNELRLKMLSETTDALSERTEDYLPERRKYINALFDYIKEKQEIINRRNNMKIALCAIAKNENLYIREWVEWYKNLGISKIFLYDNNDIDGERFEDVINDYIESGFVEIIDRRGITKTVSTDQDGQTLQGLSFQDCYDTHYNEYDWICFFDIDEFLEMSNDYNLFTFLNLFKDKLCDGIHVQWRMYGDNNLLYYDDRSVFERFYNKKNESPSTLIKTILKGKEHHKDNILFCAHGPLKISGRYKQIDIINADFSQAFNPYRNQHKLNPNMGAYLDHFYCKSTEEFINRKWKKASAVTGINMNRNYDIEFLKDQYFKHTKKTEAKLQLFDNLINKKRIFRKIDKNDKIIVNFTTWTKRDMYIPFLLKYFKNQTLYPDEIICWLSEDEYHGIIPKSIQYCLDNNLLTDVKFVKGNIYGHKRYETFKYNLDAYNILIDDDLYYPIDYVESLYKACKEYPDDVICYYSRHEIYKHNGVRSFTDVDKDASFGNRYFSGLAAFSPYLFPMESFKYSNLRDKYCQKCDDSWVNGWLFKKNIKVRAVKNWGKYSPLNVIGSTQEDGIYETHNGLKINGIMQASINIANAVTVTNTQNIAKEIWPDFNIDEVTTYNK